MNEETISFYDLGQKTIRELETDSGILASGRSEIYGCIFGRDTLITSMKLLRAYEKTKEEYYLLLVRKALTNLAKLQGKEANIQSGEELGKIIHEYRPDNHFHLTRDLEKPWYIYPDNTMRNYDSVDSTLLFLMACFKYYCASGDREFLENIIPNAKLALDWLLNRADGNNDGFIDYKIQHEERIFGGLKVKSWMDSGESLFHEDGFPIEDCIAPVEVQAYAHISLCMWAELLRESDPDLSKLLSEKAKNLKKLFNNKFVYFSENENNFSIFSALDGKGKGITSIRSSMGHILWAAIEDDNGRISSILQKKYIPYLVKRLLEPDLFEPFAGIRTLSTKSVQFDANSYHNGSIWPHDTSIIAEGLDSFGYLNEAIMVREALFCSYEHFKTPIELFVYENGNYSEYKSPTGQTACRQQAWSAASMLSDSLILVK